MARSPRPTRRRPGRPSASPGSVRPSKPTRALGGELTFAVVTPLADPAKAARWREQLARLERASAAEAEQLDERFEAVDEILTDELYLQGGFRSDRAFIAKHLPGMSRRTVDDHRVAARYFDAAQLRAFKVTNLAYLARILERKNGGLAFHALPRLRSALRQAGWSGGSPTCSRPSASAS